MVVSGTANMALYCTTRTTATTSTTANRCRLFGVCVSDVDDSCCCCVCVCVLRSPNDRHHFLSSFLFLLLLLSLRALNQLTLLLLLLLLLVGGLALFFLFHSLYFFSETFNLWSTRKLDLTFKRKENRLRQTRCRTFFSVPCTEFFQLKSKIASCTA